MIVLIFFHYVLLVKHFICFVPAQVARYVKTKAFMNQESLSAVHFMENSVLNFTILVSYET